MNPRERFLAVFDETQRYNLDRVPLFVQEVNSDFLQKFEDDLFTDIPENAVGIPNWDAAWLLGFDGIFADFPSLCVDNAD